MGSPRKRDPQRLITYIEKFMEYKTRPKIEECHHYLDRFTTLEHFEADIFQCEICETIILNRKDKGIMSWLRCHDCDRYFNAKEELDWKDRDGRISCELCVEDEEALTSAEYDELQETDAKS